MISYHAARQQVREGNYSPLYLLFGEEKYLHEEFIELLADQFLGADAEFGREKIDGASVALPDLLEIINESELFVRRRLIVVENSPYLSPPWKGDDEDRGGESTEQGSTEENYGEMLDHFLKRDDSGSPEAILLFSAPRVDRRKRFFKAIDLKGIAVECSPLRGDALSAWIRERTAALGKKIDSAALERLMISGEQNLHYLSGELEKYSAYIGDEGNVITAQVVDLLFSGDVQGDVFKLADAVAEGEMERAESILEMLLRKREKPLQIFFMIVRHYRLLLQAFCLLREGLPPAEFPSAMQVHPYVARKVREQAAKFNGLVLEEVIIAMQESDYRIKTGRIEPVEALKLLLGRIDYLQGAKD